MARPRKDPNGADATARMEAALLELIQNEPLERISVGQVARAAGCGRSAFYYHYASIYDLFDQLVDKHLPCERLANAVAAALHPALCAGSPTDAAEPADARPVLKSLAAELQANREILQLVLCSKACDRFAQRVKTAALREWDRVMGQLGGEFNERARLVFEFAFNGMFGALAYQAGLGSPTFAQDVQAALAPQIPQALLACMLKTQTGPA